MRIIFFHRIFLRLLRNSCIGPKGRGAVPLPFVVPWQDGLDSQITKWSQELEATQQEQKRAELQVEYDKYVPQAGGEQRALSLPESKNPSVQQELAQMQNQKRLDELAAVYEKNVPLTRTDTPSALRESAESGTISKNKSLLGELTQDETGALLRYKSSESYKINDKLRSGSVMNPIDQEMVARMDSALSKMPTYQGTLYRNLSFDLFGGQEALDNFIAEHSEDAIVIYNSFTSTSTAQDGYPVEGEFIAHIVICEGTAAHNIDGFGNNFESEAIYPRGSVFSIDKVEFDRKGVPTIYLKEVTLGGN